MSLLYNTIFIPAGRAAIAAMKPFDEKLRARENSWEGALNEFVRENAPKKAPRIWFHAASMGEFEQAKPVIEAVKKRSPKTDVAASFFSPSGFETQKKYPHISGALYMPFDSYGDARKFVNRVDPDLAVFVRYEFWLNHLEYLKLRGIPAVLICASIPKAMGNNGAFFLRPYYKKAVRLFDEIYAVGEKHAEFFKSLRDGGVFAYSDTRLDRIGEKVKQARKNEILPRKLFDKNEFVLIAGSSWEKDESALLAAAAQEPRLRLILVPHEPEPANVSRLLRQAKNAVLFSEIEPLIESRKFSEAKRKIAGAHIIVDSVGKLLKLYAAADAAHVGGGFGAGVHSLSEPAGYGLALSCGPNLKASPDAAELIARGAVEVVRDAAEVNRYVKRLVSDSNFRESRGAIAEKFVDEAAGSSEKIARVLLEYLSGAKSNR